MDDLVQKLLGPSAITLIILAVFQFVQKLRENRTTLKGGYETREAQRNERVESRLNTMEALAEAHLPWDTEVRHNLRQLQSVVNTLEKDQGRPPTEFGDLRPAPPLFPQPDAAKK